LNMFKWAIEKEIRPDDFVTILYAGVDPDMRLVAGPLKLHMPADKWAEVIQAHNKEEEQLLNKFAIMLDEAKIPHEKALRRGDAREIILETAESKHTDLIIMGTRGQGQLKRALAGSVSTHVVHHSKVPVLVYRKA